MNEPAVPAAKTQQFSLPRVLLLLVQTPTLFVLLLTFASFFARYWWRAEQFCHFRLQYGWLLVIAAAVLMTARQQRFALVAIVGALVNFAFVLPIYWITQPGDIVKKPWRLISYNLLSSNNRYDDVLAMLRKEDADVVLLYEVSPAWARQCEKLSAKYPHQHLLPQSNNFGIALLSRTPWKSVEAIEWGPAGAPSIVAKFDTLGPDLTLIGTHPLPPGSRAIAKLRNAQLRAIGEYCQQQNEAAARAGVRNRLIVAGDLNITSYSPYFHDLLREANLRDSRQGFGVQASWSPRIPLLFSIPIDHCLVSPPLEVLSRRVGPRLGSDHRPVIIDIR
jgi:endonuclease/exonuclease/phosphatase (EEP) superfamily protein YafD